MSLVYRQQTACFRWPLAKLTPSSDCGSCPEEERLWSSVYLLKKALNIAVHIAGCSSWGYAQPIHIKCNQLYWNSTTLPLGLGLFLLIPHFFLRMRLDPFLKLLILFHSQLKIWKRACISSGRTEGRKKWQVSHRTQISNLQPLYCQL